MPICGKQHARTGTPGLTAARRRRVPPPPSTPTTADATGLGREADFAATWINTGFDAAFLISYKDDKKIKADGRQGDIDANLTAIPEPTTLALLGLGLAGLGFGWRKGAA